MSLDKLNISQFERTSINSRITNSDAQAKANIIRSSEQRPKVAMRLVLPLDVEATAEKPYLISQPFNGYYVVDASDSSTRVKLAYGGIDRYSTDNYTELGKNDSSFSLEEIKQATLMWDAQAGKTLTIIFYLGVDFRPGSLISAVSGGVSIIDGSAISESALSSTGATSSVLVTAAAAVMILPADPDRKLATLQVDGPINIGGPGVTALIGLAYGAGTFQVRNTGPIYAIGNGADATLTGIVES